METERFAVFVSTVAMAVLLSPPATFAGTWIHVGPPDENVAEAVAVDPAFPSAIYAATAAGVYRSFDSGTTWLLGSRHTGFIEILTIRPFDHLLYGAGECIGCPVVYKSRNGGRHWLRRTRGIESSNVTSLAIDPAAPDTIYAGTYDDGIFKTVNGGRLWTELVASPHDEDVLGVALDPQTPSTVYAAVSGPGVWKSTDAGANWFATNSGITGLDLTLQGIAIDPQTPSTIYVSGYLSGHVLASTDSGATWIDKSAGLPGAGVIRLLVDATTPTNLYAGTRGAGVFRSSDAGVTWSEFNDGLPSTATIGDLNLVPSAPPVLYAAGSGGVFRCIDP